MIIRLIDDVADRARAGELEDESIYPGYVIGHKKKPASRQILQTQRRHPIKAPHEWPANEIERAFGARPRRHRLSFTIGVGQTAIGNYRWNLSGKN